MPADHSALVHLVSLIEAARAHADTLGVNAGTTVGLLDEALVAAHAIEAHQGHADEGIRPGDLTTDNDK